MKEFSLISFYKYVEVENSKDFVTEHLPWCISNNIKGKIYIAKEGINGSVSAERDKIEKFKDKLKSWKIFEDIIFKEDHPDEIPFLKMHIRIKDELVNSGLKVNPLLNPGKRISPEGLFYLYQSGKDFEIIDIRNWYESKIGRFKNAVTPGLKNFRDWINAADSLEEIKDKTIVTYCTGGIRCEKASAYLVEKGFKDVYQLDGGIISYTKKFPDTFWEGAVFVFDERKVVEPNTKEELKYISNCHFCGEPASYYINCHNLDCDKIIITCHKCKVENDYCCSEDCRKSANRRKKYYG